MRGPRHHERLFNEYLSSNGITSLESGAFTGLTQLTYLCYPAARYPAFHIHIAPLTKTPSGPSSPASSLISCHWKIWRSATPAAHCMLLQVGRGKDLNSNSVASLELGAFSGLTRLMSMSSCERIAQRPRAHPHKACPSMPSHSSHLECFPASRRWCPCGNAMPAVHGTSSSIFSTGS